MKVYSLLSTLGAATTLLSGAVVAQDTPAPTTTDQPGTITAPTDAVTTPPPTTTAPGPSPKPTSGTTAKPVTGGKSPLDSLKVTDHGFDYQMPPVRVVHARVQGDKPELVDGRFVSIHGKGDLERGYVAMMDTVNTASVEGALMYVQAEGIDELSRGADKRCERKSDMKWIVFYEILIAQSNETIAQYRDKWNVPEYGWMQPMDGGRCTPISGSTFPPECLQFNGVDEQPNLGPFVGAGVKSDDIRAPYPDTLWFSFPHTCPLQKWGEKEDLDTQCRVDSRKGLCDIDKAPDGVECTFAYDILGWVAIDDVVGITDLKDDSGNYYEDFKQWCEASKDHVEFKRGPDNDKLEGLPFWDNPLDTVANNKRAEQVVTMYENIISGEYVSRLIPSTDRANFKPLRYPEELAAINPPCYKTVPSCNSGNGCERLGFSQVCMPCKSAACKTDPSFQFPELAKAPTTLSDDKTTSVADSDTGANGRIDGTQNTEAPSSRASSLSVWSAMGLGLTAVAAVFAL